MPAGNYDEGIERVNLAGAADEPDQSQLRTRQSRRMRDKVIGAAVAVLLALFFYGSYWIQTLGRTDAAVKTANAVALIQAGEYEQALDVADEVANSSHYQWYGHLYKIVSLIHLERFKEADAEADKLASYFQSGMKMPRRFLKTYLLAKMLNHNYDEDLKGYLSDRYPPAIVKIIREVRELKNVCYPIVSVPDIMDLHSVPKEQGCFQGPNDKEKN